MSACVKNILFCREQPRCLRRENSFEIASGWKISCSKQWRSDWEESAAKKTATPRVNIPFLKVGYRFWWRVVQCNGSIVHLNFGFTIFYYWICGMLWLGWCLKQCSHQMLWQINCNFFWGCKLIFNLFHYGNNKKYLVKQVRKRLIVNMSTSPVFLVL